MIELLDHVEGAIRFEDVSFRYQTDGPEGLAQVKRFGRGATYEQSIPESIHGTVFEIVALGSGEAGNVLFHYHKAEKEHDSVVLENLHHD